MSEINLAQQLDETQLAQLLRLIETYPDTIKFDRKLSYSVDSEEIKLSNSIVMHKDEYGNVFYDVYAKDNEIDGQKEKSQKTDKKGKVITEEVSAKKNLIGQGGFGKVKPVIARFYKKDDRLVQITNPELVVKVFKRNCYPANAGITFEEAVNGEVTALKENYPLIAVSDSRPAKSNDDSETKKETMTRDVVMPKLPSNLANAWHAIHTHGDPTFKIMIDRLTLVIAMLEAVDKFHEDHNTIHGDIKIDNFCYDQKTKVAFLIDFCTKKLTLGEPLPVVEKFPHTVGFMAPEVARAFVTKEKLVSDRKMDVYSLGYNIACILNMLMRGNDIRIPCLPATEERSKLGKRIAGFVQSLMDTHPKKRPEIKDAIQFFHEVRDHYINYINKDAKNVNKVFAEQLSYEKRQAKEIPLPKGREQTLKDEIEEACSPFQEEVTESARAQHSRPEVYFKKLDILVLNIDEVIRDIQQQQIRLIHKTEKHYSCDFSEGQTLPPVTLTENDEVSKETASTEGDSLIVFSSMREEDRAKYGVLANMVTDLERQKKAIKTQVNALKTEIAQPENQVNLEHANQLRVSPKNVFAEFVQDTINIVSLDKDEDKNKKNIIEKQTKFAWLRVILRGIASLFSETKGLPASAQALITAGHKLGAVLRAPAATVEAAIHNHETPSSNRNSISSDGEPPSSTTACCC
jgi:hypothetical protein